MTKRKKTTQKKTEVPKLPRVRNSKMVKAADITKRQKTSSPQIIDENDPMLIQLSELPVEVLKKILSDNPSEVTPEKKAQTPFERLSQNTNPRMKEKKGSYGLIIMCGTRRGN